ncbi:hypothetical protein HQ520_12535, partial [bacterium]|nr:hypothetical protein [bacterium]
MRCCNRKTTWMKAWVIFALVAMLLCLSGCRKKTPQDLLDEAMSAAQRGDLIGVQYKCEQIIEADPDSPVAIEARRLMAFTLAQSGELDEAREIWAEIIARAPMTAEVAKAAYLNRISSWEQAGEIQRAIDEIQRTSGTLQAAPDFQKEVTMRLAVLYEKSNQIE